MTAICEYGYMDNDFYSYYSRFIIIFNEHGKGYKEGFHHTSTIHATSTQVIQWDFLQREEMSQIILLVL